MNNPNKDLEYFKSDKQNLENQIAELTKKVQSRNRNIELLKKSINTFEQVRN